MPPRSKKSLLQQAFYCLIMIMYVIRKGSVDMSFTTLKFVLFFAVAAAGRYLLPQKIQKHWLLLACWIFYMFAGPAFVLLLLAGTAVSFFCGLACEKQLLGKRKLWVALGVVYTLGVLFLFKYLNFFCATVLPLAGIRFEALSLALPVGISFFSFAVSGYLFDVYRGKLTAERRLVDYALFVAFFPCLLAGPIGRAREFLPQVRQMPAFDALNFRRGLLRFVWGAAKKMAVADLLGTVVDTAYADPAGISSGALLIAVCCYSLQIYYDFSAYSDMAIGSAQMLGFTVLENFRAPYLSASVKDFWKKWHISLTSWFREYLYFPLGGSRISFVRTQVNVIIVFAVSGLWHGAAWTFVIWGLLNGLYQAVGAFTEGIREKIRRAARLSEDSNLLLLLRYACTFALLTVAWIFFRAASFDQAIYVMKRCLLVLRDGVGWASVFTLLPRRKLCLTAALLLPCFAEDVRISRGKGLPALEKTSFGYWFTLAALLLVIALFGVYGEGFNAKDFLYFDF